MKPDSARTQASRAVIALREALGLTQQRFAVEVLGSALNTVARYETTNPPHGAALLRLAAVAQSAAEKLPAERTETDEKKLLDISDWFRFLYLGETLGNQTTRLVRFGNEAWLVAKLNDDQIGAAVDFLEFIAPLQAQNARRNLRAASQLQEAQAIRTRVSAGEIADTGEGGQP